MKKPHMRPNLALLLALLSSVLISGDLKLIHDFLYTFTNQRLFVLLINEMEIGVQVEGRHHHG